MMARRLQVLAAALLLAVPVQAQDRASLIDSILENPSWSLVSTPVEFRPDRIRALVGDNTEAVLAYGLIGATQVAFHGLGGTVEMTLYEMIDSTAAFGLFALERDWLAPGFRSATVGAEGYRQLDRLVFWQSRYVGILEGAPPTVAALADPLVSRIPGRSGKAPVSRHLPPEGLIVESEKYVLTASLFREVVNIDPTDLGFENSVEVAVADYRTNSGSARVAALLYPTQHLALRHLEAWIASSGGVQPYARSGPLVAIVADSDSAPLAESILSALKYQSEVTWNEPLPDPLTLPRLILTVFTWIGIALMFTAIAGVGFGGLRIYMKRHYPGRFFGHEGDMEFIQLKIDQSVTRRQLDR